MFGMFGFPGHLELLIIGVIVAGIIIAVVVSVTSASRHPRRVPCPFCAEYIMPDAKLCPYCRSELKP